MRFLDVPRRHFIPLESADLTVSERKLPFRVRADLQQSIDRLFDDGAVVLGFYGVLASGHTGTGSRY